MNEVVGTLRIITLWIIEIDEPTNIQDALQSSYAEEWKAAADSEYNSLIENKTWKLVQLPPGRKAIGSKWVLNETETRGWSSRAI